MSVLATETLIQIFEHLDNPRDLFHVVQTCLVFHGIAIELLYRHIQYRSLKSFNAQTARWKNAQDGLYSFPQSVVLHDVLRVPQGARWMWNDHYKGTEALQVQPQIDLWVRLLSFTFLHTLSISHCLLPDSESFSYLLQGCQSLRKLSIETCSFQRKPRGFSVSYGLFPWLPLEELSLLGENTVTDYRWPYRPPSDAEAGSFLHLLTVRSIRTLNIDLDYQNCAFLASRTSSNVISFGNLERLRLRISKRCAEGNIPAFLNAHCASVKTLELLDFADLPSDHLRLRPGALRHLTNYKGPAALAPAVAAAGCPLGRLETSDLMMSVSQASKVLGEVGGHRPQLEALDITIQEWDVEIHSGCPDEVCRSFH
ncbi:uncharacterized protein BT62DRAFT_934166 [Guyanagaster necrorhizus]|uniref:F-box domain-containing protein n=1 Tax=Guyanagaster necrorhizus TaxID=856835 RepID=A0A9P7VQC3_9AGAR|nr:uncharacterized protein BT62DRAFT_934166 [Guyanagaster necrorhizus MCA 3950]KAG7444525.1 hypothetical protein BT62DRAFT_934166 [Guyanagaster necrorhizus MCA 3950]